MLAGKTIKTSELGRRRCAICGDPVAPEHLEPDCEDTFHKICFAVAVADLSARLIAEAENRPDLYRKVSPGKYELIAAECWKTSK